MTLELYRLMTQYVFSDQGISGVCKRAQTEEPDPHLWEGRAIEQHEAQIWLPFKPGILEHAPPRFRWHGARLKALVERTVN